MSYKTIVVHVDDSPHALLRYDAASRIALTAGAHLIGLASTGLSKFFRATVAMDFASLELAPHLDALRQRASVDLDEFARVTAAAGVKNAERRQTDDELVQILSAVARYGDLCVLGKYTAHAPAEGKRQMAAGVAAASGCPVLLVPDQVSPALPPRRILLGWNGSKEAGRAMHFAMPMLQSAVTVYVAILDDALDSDRDIRPAIEIAQALARHGVTVEVIQKRGDGDVGHTLMALASEHECELIVMGCYGHSRVRELLLGGATHSVLTATTVPVFMAT